MERIDDYIISPRSIQHRPQTPLAILHYPSNSHVITFNNGPAHGVRLLLRRSPRYLRVVVNPKGEWDALNESLDVAAADESIYVYEIHVPPTLCHIRMTNGRGGTYYHGIYEYRDPQPADENIRDNGAWELWVAADWNERTIFSA